MKRGENKKKEKKVNRGHDQGSTNFIFYFFRSFFFKLKIVREGG